MSLVRTCDACGITLREQPNDWDWFRLARGVGSGASTEEKEACGVDCAQVLLIQLQHQNEAEWREAEAEVE